MLDFWKKLLQHLGGPIEVRFPGDGFRIIRNIKVKTVPIYIEKGLVDLCLWGHYSI